MPRHTYALVACARWEAADLQEWVAYHRSVGFDHIYLYSNDDDPAAQFEAVAAYVRGRRPFVTFCHWPEIGQQDEMYLHFLQTFSMETEWFSFLGIDEFFVLKGVDDIGRFMQPYGDSTDCLYFNWINYGHSDRARREPGSVLKSYLQRADFLDAHTKLLCRSALVDAAGIRRGIQSGLGAFWHFLD